MKKYLLPLLSFALMLTSCEVTVGGETDDQESQEIKNGFSYESYSVSINGVESIKNNEVIRGENIIIEFDGVQNATLKDDFQHVGISLKVIDSEGNILDQYEDLLSKIEQQDPKIDFFEAFFTVPLNADEETITMEVVLFDKYGTISYDFKETYSLVSKVAQGTDGVKLTTNLENVDMTSQIFVGKRQFEKTPSKVDKGDEVLIYINGANGFVEEENMVDMHYVMKIINSDNEEVFFQEDELQGSVEGYETYPLYFSKVFQEFDAGKYTWSVLITDTKSDKFIDASAAITVK